MIDPKVFDDLAIKLAGSIPTGLQSLQDDMSKNLRRSLEAGLSHLDLVTREEFDLQRAVLARSREKIQLLEQQIAALEQAMDEKPSSTSPVGNTS